MQEHMQKVNLSVLDYLKLVLAILIIILHTGGGGYFSHYFIQTVCRIAVPFFLVISGYFFYSKLNENKKVKIYLLRVFFLYIAYSFIYIPFSLKLQCYTLGWRSILYALVHGTFIQLWYFPALILAVLLVVCLYKICKSLYIILGIGLVFHIWGILAYIYKIVPSIYDIIPWSIKLLDNSPNNFLYMGIVYVCLGMIIYQRKKLGGGGKNNVLVLLAGLVVAIIIWALEAKYLFERNASPTICFGMFFVVAIVFCLLVNVKFSSRKSENYRNVSTIIFGIHYIYYFIYLWFISSRVPDSIDGKILFFFTLFMSILSAIIILRVSHKLKILKILY